MEELYNQLQTVTVPAASMVLMVISGVLSVAIPVFLAVYFKKKFGCNLKCFLVGALVWIVFARLLEGLLHSVVLGSPAGAAIQGNIWLYALYGGLMAGLFEEVGRFVGMIFFLKDCMDNDKNSLMYGTGHGGMEAVMLLGFSMLSNLMVSFQINNRALAPTYQVIKTLPEDQAGATLSGLIALTETPSYMFVMGIIERIPAIAFHIALSVLVWKAVKESKIAYLIIAISFHFLLDWSAVLVNSVADNVVLVEGFIYAATAVLICLIVFIVREKKSTIS